VNGTSTNGATPIRERIQARLDELNENAAWLAEKVGVSRSTITRILNGERNPTPETLHEIAPVLGVEITQLVAGTDAAERVKEAQNIVSRHDYEGAVRQVIEYERKANDLAAHVRDLTAKCDEERQRVRKLSEELGEQHRACSTLRDERDRARREQAHADQDARRYREGLEKAVADVVTLRAHVRELGAAVESGHMTGRIGAILAGVAAAVSVASYLGNDTPATTPTPRVATRTRKPATTKRSTKGPPKRS